MSTDAPGRHEVPLAPPAGTEPTNQPYGGQGRYAELDQRLLREAPVSPGAPTTIGAGEVASAAVVDKPKSRYTTGQKATAAGLAGLSLLSLGFGASQVDWDKYFGNGLGPVDEPDGGDGGGSVDNPVDNPDGVSGEQPSAPLHPMFQDLEGGNPSVPQNVVDMFQDGTGNDHIQDKISVLLGTDPSGLIAGGDNNIVVSEGESHQYGYTQHFEMEGDPSKSYTMSVMQPSGDFVNGLFDRVDQGEVLEVLVDKDSPDPDDMYFYDPVNDVIHYFHNHFPLEDGSTTSVVFTINVSGGIHGQLGQYLDSPEDLRLAVDKYVSTVFNFRDQYFGDGGGSLG